MFFSWKQGNFYSKYNKDSILNFFYIRSLSKSALATDIIKVPNATKHIAMSSIHDSAYSRAFKVCPCGTMANSNSQRTCHNCQQDFVTRARTQRGTEDGRGRITKRCTACGTAAPSNRTAVCVCGERFQTRSRRPQPRRRPAEVLNIFENPPQVQFSSSMQDIQDILMGAPIMFSDSDSPLTVPNDGFGEFSEFDAFFNPPVEQPILTQREISV